MTHLWFDQNEFESPTSWSSAVEMGFYPAAQCYTVVVNITWTRSTTKSISKYRNFVLITGVGMWRTQITKLIHNDTPPVPPFRSKLNYFITVASSLSFYSPASGLHFVATKRFVIKFLVQTTAISNPTAIAASPRLTPTMLTCCRDGYMARICKLFLFIYHGHSVFCWLTLLVTGDRFSRELIEIALATTKQRPYTVGRTN